MSEKQIVKQLKIKFMKTMRLLLLAFFGIVLFQGVNAQAPPFGVEMTNAGGIDTVIIGKRTPYFVMPDPILNSGFAAAYDTNVLKAAQGLLSSWTWSVTAAGTVAKEGNSAEGDGPYVEIVWSTATTATISVAEVSAAPASCADATPVTQSVQVIDTFDYIVANNPATQTTYLCEGALPVNVQIDDYTYNGVQTNSTLNMKLDYRISRLNSDLSFNSQLHEAEDTLFQVAQPGASGPVVFWPAKQLYAIGGNITEYRFSFGAPAWGGAEDNGINDHITRKCDYLALATKDGSNPDQFTYYDQETVGSISDEKVFIVYPAPVTGPIYYVPNSFNK